MADTRIYLVVEKGAGASKRLVEATSAAQAIRHCARNVYEAQAAAPKDVAALMGSGVTIEQATEQTQTVTT